MARTYVVVVALAVTAVAIAAPKPYKERLTPDEVEAATKATQAALPPVDKPAVQKCAALPLDTDPEIAVAALCMRKAGALGAAIMMWKQLTYHDARSAEGKEAIRQLGPAFDAAGDFASAATWHDTYARRFSTETDAPDRELRAVCTWRQLDMATEAERGFKYLRAMRSKVKRDHATLCDAIRPILVPATK